MTSSDYLHHKDHTLIDRQDVLDIELTSSTPSDNSKVFFEVTLKHTTKIFPWTVETLNRLLSHVKFDSVFSNFETLGPKLHKTTFSDTLSTQAKAEDRVMIIRNIRFLNIKLDTDLDSPRSPRRKQTVLDSVTKVKANRRTQSPEALAKKVATLDVIKSFEDEITKQLPQPPDITTHFYMLVRFMRKKNETLGFWMLDESV